MTVLRWKGQSLQFHRNLAGAESKAVQKQGILPQYAHLAYIIASCAAAIAGMAKKTWRDADPKQMSLTRIRSLRARINGAFDHLETLAETEKGRPSSALVPSHAEQATINIERHGNFAMLALGAMEDAGKLAHPLMKVAEGSRTLSEAKPEIDFESADVRIQLHIISEQAGVSSETSTAAKWMLVRERFPEEAFDLLRRTDAPKSNPAAKNKKKVSP